MRHILCVVAFPWLVGPEFLRIPDVRARFVRDQLAQGSGTLLAALSLETAGDPRSANSAAPQGCVGQGYGAAGPMSTVVLPVPCDAARVLRATAQGIVTRMGQDPQGLGGAAIEPGPAGMRPVVLACSRALGAFDCAAAAPSARKRSAVEGAAAAIHTPPSNTGVNKVGSGHGV